MKRLALQLILCMFFCVSVAQAAAETVVAIDEQQLEQLQNKMVNDPQIMELIQALKNDPEMVSLLNDPSFLQAITSRDVGKLERDPRVRRLLDNQKIREIIKRVQ